MPIANRQGLQGGIPGSASGNPRTPITDFIRLPVLQLQLQLPALQLRLPAPSLPLLRAQLQAIPLLRALVEGLLEIGMKYLHTVTYDVAEN